MAVETLRHKHVTQQRTAKSTTDLMEPLRQKENRRKNEDLVGSNHGVSAESINHPHQAEHVGQEFAFIVLITGQCIRYDCN